MKKLFFYAFMLLLPICALCMTACDNATEIRAASISEITAAGSKNYGIKISFQEDKRLEKKGVDVQVMCNRAIDNVVIWQEGGQKQSIAFTNKNQWYSLTTLLCNAQNQYNTEKFEQFDKVLTKTYLFNSGQNISLTFRVVVGDSQPNASGKGEVLTGSVQVSEEFTLKFD